MTVSKEIAREKTDDMILMIPVEMIKKSQTQYRLEEHKIYEKSQV